MTVYSTLSSDGSNAWSQKKVYRFVVFIAACVVFAGCAQNARIMNETVTGGTAVYTYVHEQDVLSSSGRRDALRLLEEKCLSGYRISREGQIVQVDKAVDRAWMGQLSRNGQVSLEKRWAIQFICK